MKTPILIFLFALGLVLLGSYCESKKDPYDLGTHFDYTITCESGFVYKVLDNKRGVVQILNSDGTPLKCGNKIY